MGLAQTIKFQYKKEDLEDLLLSLEYEKIKDDFYRKLIPGMDIEIKIIDEGIYIHRSGKYFEDLGKLIDGLGRITVEITIEDYP